MGLRDDKSFKPWNQVRVTFTLNFSLSTLTFLTNDQPYDSADKRCEEAPNRSEVLLEEDARDKT